MSCLVSALLGLTSSFAPVTLGSSWTRTCTQVKSTTGATDVWAANAERAFREAEEATGKFGVASTEARLAWELVEEMEESLGSSIASLFPKPLDQECDVETDEAKCRDFEMKMSRLQEIAATAQSINYQIKFQVEKLQNLKVEPTKILVLFHFVTVVC
mmetsp:Transcript_17097/g.29264  ORF Transcript_17097/g.29264 Transcript_17097/m.29264 type:complete len:158 (-) Transcript_17097:458-931(-)